MTTPLKCAPMNLRATFSAGKSPPAPTVLSRSPSSAVSLFSRRRRKAPRGRALHEFEPGDFVTVSMYEGSGKEPVYTFTGLLDMSPMDDKTAADINDWEARTLDAIAGEE